MEMDKNKRMRLMFEMEDIIIENKLMSNEARALLYSLIAILYREELKHYPDCRDMIREKFEAEINIIRRHLFGDR